MRFIIQNSKDYIFCSSAVHGAMTSRSFRKTCIDVFTFNMVTNFAPLFNICSLFQLVTRPFPTVSTVPARSAVRNAMTIIA